MTSQRAERDAFSGRVPHPRTAAAPRAVRASRYAYLPLGQTSCARRPFSMPCIGASPKQHSPTPDAAIVAAKQPSARRTPALPTLLRHTAIHWALSAGGADDIISLQDMRVSVHQGPPWALRMP